MYPKEERERILADLEESGMSVPRFCAQPGKPSRNSIKRWIEQAKRGELQVPERAVRGRVECRRKNTHYPEATKREALKLGRSGMRPCDIGRRLNISARSVEGWLRDDRAGANVVPERKKGGGMGEKKDDARVAGLQEELDAANRRIAVLEEIMRDPKAGDPASLSNAQKSELGERLRRERGWPLKEVLTSLRISKSSYFYARSASARRAERKAAVAERARRAFDASGGTYGYRRVRASIASGADGGEPMRVSEREVREAMRAGGMRGRSFARRIRSGPSSRPRER